MTLKFCANLSFMFRESPYLLDRYELAKEAGFKAVECAFPYEFSPEEIGTARSETGLEQVLINSYPGNFGMGERGLAAIPGKENEFRSAIEKSVVYAKKLECQKIHIMSGVVPNETPENAHVFKNNLRIAAKILKENNIVGVLEPINKYSLPNYFLNSISKAVAVIHEINSPHIRLQLDLFHLQLICGNLTKNIESLFPLVDHIQVAQVPDRNEPNTPGEINFKYIFNVLEDLSYKGWIGLEYIPKGKTTENLKWITDYGYTL